MGDGVREKEEQQEKERRRVEVKRFAVQDQMKAKEM